jgi:DNA polymerase-3 subunit alpha
MSAVAVTDHGVVSGSIQLYQEGLKQGVKPLIGMEAYLSPTDDHTLREAVEWQLPYYHLNLLAMNEIGVSELYQLSSIAHLEGKYYKPRISLSLLEKIGKNLIVLGACVKGPVSWNLYQENKVRAKGFAARIKDSFPNRFYLELMDHGFDWQKTLNVELIELSKTMDIPWVPTNDAHFLNREDHYIHSLMMCLQLKKKLSELQDSGMMYSEECYVKSQEEMISLFGIEPCRRTLDIANMIDIKLSLGKTIFPLPPEEIIK